MADSRKRIRRRTFLGALSSISLSGCNLTASTTNTGDRSDHRHGLHADPWTTFSQNPGNTGWNSSATPPRDEVAGSRIIATGEKGDIIAPPVVFDGQIFVGSDSKLHVFAIDEEIEDWNVSVRHAGGKFAPVSIGNTVYIADISNKRGQILAVDTENASTKWSIDAQIRSHLKADNDTIYYKEFDENGVFLTAIAADDGSKRWVARSRCDEIRYFLPPPAIGDGRIFVSLFDCTDSEPATRYLAALDDTDGRVEWTFESFNVSRWSAPAVFEKTVYIGHERGVVAIGSSTGKEKWRFSTDDEVITSPVVSENNLFVGDRSNTWYSITLSDGEEVWRSDSPVPIDSLRTDPVLANGTIYLGGNRLAALDASSGDEQWTFDVDTYSSSFTQPAIVADYLVAGICAKSDPGKYYDTLLCVLE